MDPELKRELGDIRALVKDNHRMLRAIRRHQWYGVISTVVVWAVIFALPLYLYQRYLQPFIAGISSTEGTTASGPFGLPTSAELEKLINSFKARQ